MKNRNFLQTLRRSGRGQSLVETAVFLPILLLLIAGVLEISNLLVTQNRVQTGARVGTGFGATNYDASAPITDTFQAMSIVAMNNVTETLDLAEERWDIYTVKATVNAAGDGFDEWLWGHPYGSQQVFSVAEWNSNQGQIQNDILDAIEGSANGLEIISTISYHNRDSFIGLGYFDPGLTRIRGLTVMRITETSGDNDGCDLFPITLRVENLSLYPENFAGSMAPGGRMYNSVDYEVGNTNIVPDHDYDDGPPEDHSGFLMATGGNPLIPNVEPNPGDIFEAREETNPGGFGWLSWDGDVSSPALRESLDPPGNLSLQVPPPPGFVNYVNPDDPDDHLPNIGDWVQGSTGNMNNVVDLLDDHINSGREVQILVFDQVRNNGSLHDYRILGFVQVYIRGRRTVGADKRILIEFIRWAEPCFAPASYP